MLSILNYQEDMDYGGLLKMEKSRSQYSVVIREFEKSKIEVPSGKRRYRVIGWYLIGERTDPAQRQIIKGIQRVRRQVARATLRIVTTSSITTPQFSD